VRWFLVVVATAVACSRGGGGARAPGPAPVEVVASGPVYFYPEEIAAYPADDRGAYLVRPIAGATAAQRAALIDSLAPPDPDDIIEDGVVLRLSAEQRAQLAARDDVGAIEILQPARRRGLLWDKEAAVAEVRIDLFADAADDERDAVARWLEKRGAIVLWRGPAALRARVPQDAIAEAARLGPVRWVE
jgi:hypothetical protein